MDRNGQLRRWTALILGALLFCLLPSPSSAASKAGVQEDIPGGLVLLPRVGLSLEYGGFIVHQDNYTSLLRRHLEVDFLQYRRHILFLEFNEDTYFGTPSDRWDFNLMKYRVTLGGYRYDFGSWYLGVLFRHECNNPFLIQNYRTLIDRERANLYTVGVEVLSKAMRLGMKNRDINFDSSKSFEFLGHWHGSASVNKTVTKENADLDWLITALVRYDILRYRRMVPYLEVGAELLTGQATRVVPSVEFGARLHFGRVDLTPLFKWTRYQEYLTESTFPQVTVLAAKNALFAGARLEALLDAEYLLSTPQGTGVQFMPEIHGNAAYGLHLNQKYFNGYGKIELDFEVLRWQPWTVFFYTHMNFDSREQDFKPDKVVYSMQYGLTYGWDNYFVEAFVENAKRLDANVFRGTQERFNLAGLRAGTKGMKPGQVNFGINFAGPATFQWLNRWNVQASVGHFFQNRDWQYLWEVSAQLRWDLLRWYFIVPYVQGEVAWLAGGGPTDDAVEYAAETGLRMHGVLDLLIFYRFQHKENVIFFRGPAQDQSIFGVKVLF